MFTLNSCGWNPQRRTRRTAFLFCGVPDGVSWVKGRISSHWTGCWYDMRGLCTVWRLFQMHVHLAFPTALENNPHVLWLICKFSQSCVCSFNQAMWEQAFYSDGSVIRHGGFKAATSNFLPPNLANRSTGRSRRTRRILSELKLAIICNK